jgi:hypothetical protein
MTDEEMQDYFPTVFPKMFVGHYGGIAVGKGWFNILRVLCQNIQTHIDWKNRLRQQDIEMFNRREQGYMAVLEHFQGKSTEPSEWDIERAEEIMKNSVTIPPEVTQVTIQQVKEKFGGLRFYYSGGDEYISGLVSMAESVAGFTCEECGDHGEGRNGGWIRTLCDEHEARYQVARGNYNE